MIYHLLKFNIKPLLLGKSGDMIIQIYSLIIINTLIIFGFPVIYSCSLILNSIQINNL